MGEPKELRKAPKDEAGQPMEPEEWAILKEELQQNYQQVHVTGKARARTLADTRLASTDHVRAASLIQTHGLQ